MVYKYSCTSSYVALLSLVHMPHAGPRAAGPTDQHAREHLTPARAHMGVHQQPQEGLSRVGIHVPCGRLSARREFIAQFSSISTI